MFNYAARFGKHLIDASCAKQSVLALGSGQTEFYALVIREAAHIPDLGANRLQEAKAHDEDRLKSSTVHERALDSGLRPEESAPGLEFRRNRRRVIGQIWGRRRCQTPE